MFRSTARTLLHWWADFSDDILGADLPSDQYADDEGLVASERVSVAPGDALAYHRAHPHRRRLECRRVHRPGQVPQRPAFCLSPVRASSPASGSQAVGR